MEKRAPVQATVRTGRLPSLDGFAARAGGHGGVHRVTSHATEIRFLRQEIDAPSASVRVDALGEQPLAIAFIDALGRTTPLAPRSERSIGQDGGVLSMAAQSGGIALVTVRYD